MAAAQRRLRAAGFKSHCSPKFSVDPNQEETLTTCVEYLRFECLLLDTCRATVDQRQASHDSAWSSLDQVGVPRDSEAESGDLGASLSWDVNKIAGEASYEGLGLSSVKAQRSADTSNEPARPLVRVVLDQARPWGKAKQKVELQQLRVEWTLAQLSSIEEPKPTTAGKRKRQREDEDAEGDAAQSSAPKRKKRELGKNGAGGRARAGRGRLASTS